MALSSGFLMHLTLPCGARLTGGGASLCGDGRDGRRRRGGMELAGRSRAHADTLVPACGCAWVCKQTYKRLAVVGNAPARTLLGVALLWARGGGWRDGGKHSSVSQNKQADQRDEQGAASRDVRPVTALDCDTFVCGPPPHTSNSRLGSSGPVCSLTLLLSHFFSLALSLHRPFSHTDTWPLFPVHHTARGGVYFLKKIIIIN